MPLKKKPANNKRAALPRTVDYTRRFILDWERLIRSGRYDMKRLKEAMLLLIANDGPLAPEWRDHPLKGGYSTAVQARKCGLSGAGIGRRLSPTRVFSFGTAPAS